MKQLLAALSLSFTTSLASSPAAALSCVALSVEQAFQTARDAPEVYLPVLGTFTGFRQRADAQSTNGRDRRFAARFTGRAVSSRGLGRAIDVPVTVTERCIGPWCPALAPDLTVLTFLQRDGTGYAFQVNACHGNYFADPTPAQIKTLRGCLKAKTCSQN